MTYWASVGKRFQDGTKVEGKMMVLQRRKPAVDLDRSVVARYIQLASLFRRRIQAGQWQVGEQIPTVEELAA